jgi:hypothetical protein
MRPTQTLSCWLRAKLGLPISTGSMGLSAFGMVARAPEIPASYGSYEDRVYHCPLDDVFLRGLAGEDDNVVLVLALVGVFQSQVEFQQLPLALRVVLIYRLNSDGVAGHRAVGNLGESLCNRQTTGFATGDAGEGSEGDAGGEFERELDYGVHPELYRWAGSLWTRRSGR